MAELWDHLLDLTPGKGTLLGHTRGRSLGSQESLKTQGKLGDSRLLATSCPVILFLCLFPLLVPSSGTSVDPRRFQALPRAWTIVVFLMPITK